MSTAHAFTLIVPELRDARALAAQEFEWRQLGRLAGRGSVQRIWHESDARHAALRPWQHGFLTALGLHGELDRYASAPLSIMGASPTPEPGYWMHAELIHLAAGMNSLTCVPLRSHAAIQARERDELEGSIADHLRSHGLALHANSSAGWMVAFERSLDAATVSPEAAARGDLAEAMPRGRDAGMLRRLMTEFQMLLHEHPVNARRAQSGLPAINAVWLWGGGEIATPSAQMQAAVAGDDPYVLGVCRVHGKPCMDLPPGPGELSRDADTVAVIAPVDAQTLEDRWLAPLARSVSQGAWRRLDVMIEGWRLSVSRGSLWRFWRRPRAPVEWVA